MSAASAATITEAAERLRDSWQRFLTPPVETVDEWLVADEEICHVDAPALKAFVVEELPLLALAVVVGGGVAVFGVRSQHPMLAGAGLIAAGVVLMFLRVKRWNERYTAYVLTTMRVIRVSGFFHRSLAWVPWAKVTDVRFEVSFLGRLFGYATVLIDSANEESGLKEMRNLDDPATFHAKIAELVQRKQGAVSSSFQP